MARNQNRLLQPGSLAVLLTELSIPHYHELAYRCSYTTLMPAQGLSFWTVLLEIFCLLFLKSFHTKEQAGKKPPPVLVCLQCLSSPSRRAELAYCSILLMRTMASHSSQKECSRREAPFVFGLEGVGGGGNDQAGTLKAAQDEMEEHSKEVMAQR